MLGINWPSGSGERVLNILIRNLLFRYYLPLDTGVALHFNKYESPLPKDALCQIGRVVLGKKILKYFQYNFTLRLKSPLGKGR